MAGGRIENVQIRGMACAVPEPVETSRDLAARFGEDQVRKIVKNVGVRERHIATEDICSSDLCHASAAKLLDDLGWERDSVELLVFVSFTPDYKYPATACSLQHRLGLSKQCASLDIPHACSGFVYGLWVVSSLISAGNIKRALLLAGDTPSRVVSPEDRSLAVLAGDAGSATALEWVAGAEPLFFEMASDGSGAGHLFIKAGGLRHPATPESFIRSEREDGNIRSDADIFMNGAEIFSFTLREVPKTNRALMERAGWSMEELDAVVMHQANLFMIQTLARKLKVPKDKMIENMDRYGNTSAASIPMALTGKLGDVLTNTSRHLIFLGFGAGLSWGGVAVTCGPIVIPPLTTVSPGENL